MGILNVTPDSFFNGGAHNRQDQAIQHALTMIQEGADIIDVGGESTRPGSDRVPLEEEFRRVIPVIKELAKQTDCLLSVDTMKAKVAQEALYAGAHIINDVSALTFDAEMIQVVSHSKAGVILMHMQGEPGTMQNSPVYQDVVEEVDHYFESRVDDLMAHDIAMKRIALDPGIGFGKDAQHNVQLLKGLKRLTRHRLPVVIGASRKSFLGTLTGRPVHDRLSASLGVEAYAIVQGAHIVRVHDVKASCDVAKVLDGILEEETNHEVMG